MSKCLMASHGAQNCAYALEWQNKIRDMGKLYGYEHNIHRKFQYR